MPFVEYTVQPATRVPPDSHGPGLDNHTIDPLEVPLSDERR